jgi:murein DD-endopeptidase MepM/ murein hydrolase activator NlpD
MGSARWFFGLVGSTLLVVFLCSLAFVFAYVFIVGWIAAGGTSPPLPFWARKAILEWMFDLPQKTYTDVYPSQFGYSDASPSGRNGGGGGGGGGGKENLGGKGSKNSSPEFIPGYPIAKPEGTWAGPAVGNQYIYMGRAWANADPVVGWNGYVDENAAPPSGVPFSHNIYVGGKLYYNVLQGCTFHDPDYPSHTGQDFIANQGTPDFATMSGQVVWAGSYGAWGHLVVIENGDYQTWYAHHSVILVQKGDIVKAGDMIGFLGSTGNSTGPHLHYGVKIITHATNPAADEYAWIDPRNFYSQSDVTIAGCPKK